MGRMYCCCICDLPEAKYIEFPEPDCGKYTKLGLAQAAAAHSFLGNVRVLNLLTGITEENSWWTSDKASHTAYALGRSKLSFIAFVLSRFELSRTVPRIQVDGLLRDDFAEYYVSGQLVHAQCVSILCKMLDQAERQWTYTGIALNVFENQLVLPVEMPGRRHHHSSSTAAIPRSSDSGFWDLDDGNQPIKYESLGYLASCPFSIPDPPVRQRHTKTDEYQADAACRVISQRKSTLFRLPHECINEIARYLDRYAVSALVHTCKQAQLLPDIWRVLFMRTFIWAPSSSRDIDWKQYYLQCIPHRNNFLNRARIEANCALAVRRCDSWERALDHDSAQNARQFLDSIDYNFK